MAKKLNTSTAHVVITMEGQAAHQVMEGLKKKAIELKNELKAMEDAGQIDTEDYRKKVNDLNMVQRAVNQNATAYTNLNDIVRNLNKTTLRELQRALKECRKQMQNLTADDPKMKKLMAQYRAIDNQIGKITGQWKRQEGAIVSVGKRLLSYVTIYSGFNFITGQIKSITEKNLELSDLMADIRKVSGLSADEVSRLSDELSGLDTRTTIADLHSLAFEGGRLGIQGVEGLMQFVRAGNQIKVALGEDLGEGALVELMKMNEVMGTVKDLGIEKALLATGSAINTLSASSTASGRQIADFASRLSGIATSANITTDELLGLASASSSLNLETEVSATAFNKFISEIVTHTSVVAKAAGVEKGALDELVKSGKTMEAVVVVLEALNGKGGLRGLNPIMKDLGSDGARLNQVLNAFANNTDVLRKHLNISTDAFREATSVTQEYNIKNENAAAMLARIKNSLIELTTNSTVTKWLEDVLRSLFYLPKTIEENKHVILTALAQISGALIAAKLNLASIGKMGVITWLSQFRLGLNRLAVVLNRSLTPILTKLFTAMAAHPFGTLAAAVSVLLAVMADATRKFDYLANAQKRLNELNDEYETTLGKETTHISQLFGWLNKTKKGTEEYNAAKKAIIDNYGQYLTGLGKEIEQLENVKAAYDAITTAAMNAAKARMAEKGLSSANENYAKDTGDSYKKIYEALAGGGKHSKEEIDSIVSRVRQAIDTNSAMPTDIVNLANSMSKYSYVISPTTGGTISYKYDPLNDAISTLRKRKKALDVEVSEIETRYGKLGDILGTNGKKTPTLPPEPVDEKEEDKKKRLALEAAKDEHNAIMAAIEVFYKQQEQVVNKNYLKKKITTTQREQEIADIQDRFRRSRIAADEALLDRPGAHTAWNQELQRMEKENISMTEDTTQALDNLWIKNLKDIGDKLRRFGDGEMDGIWKNLETDKTKIQEEQVKWMEEVEKLIRQYDFEAQVTEKFIAAMQKLEVFYPKMTENFKVGANKAMESLQSIYPKLFDIDIDTEKGMKTFRKLLEDAGGLGEQMINLEADKLKRLYFKTIEYGDAMVEAQKKTRDRMQKIADETWRLSGGLAREEGMEREGKKIEDKSGQLSRIGLSSEAIANDAEIELYKRRVEAAEEYRNLVVSMGGDVLAAEQKLNESIDELSNALVEKTLRHLETFKSFIDPVEDFGTKLGKAFAMDDAIKRQEAFSEALKNLVGEVGEATKKMIVEWVKQKIQHAITQKAMSEDTEDGNKKEKKAIEKGGKEAVKEMARAAKKRIGLLKEEKKEEVKTEEQGQEQQSAMVEAGGEIRATVTGKIGEMITSKNKQQTAENVQTEAKGAQAKTTLGIAEAASKTLGQLGWWGIPLVGVITALLNGLLSAAMSKVGSLFGGSADAGATAPTKLVTGMLEYKDGNVQSVLGSDGNVYSARVGGVNGSGIVSVPTLTNVNGQAALVGEQGPEIVIGRATTRALMQNNPGLLAGLVQFDKMYSGRGFRTYAGGNVQQYGANGEPLSQEEQERQQVERIMSVVTATLLPTLEGIDRSIAASNRTNAALHERLKQPINATINKYGRGGLVDEVATGLEQEKKSGRNDTVRRLFGSR